MPVFNPAPRVAGGTALLMAGGALAGLAAANALLATRARADTPPVGSFVTVEGVRLHVLDEGRGDPVLLLHGDGSLIQDFILSGHVHALAATRRVIVPDRPGYGYSERPRDRSWTPEEQARVIAAMLRRRGIERTTVLGHSFGVLVALALARLDPDLVKGLVLASGYVQPTARADIPFAAAPAAPVLGDLAAATVSPALTRLLWQRIAARLFAPAPVSASFRDFPVEMVARPSHLHAAAADAGHLLPAAARAIADERIPAMPVSILAGAGDRLVDPVRHSLRLHARIPESRLRLVEGAGHMVHHTAPEALTEALRSVP